MYKPVRWILERLAERIVPIVGEALAGSLLTILSLGRAEQQDQLEEAARRYEAEDKPHIAQALRQQAQKLSACDTTADAKRICANLALNDDPPITAPEGRSASNSGRLPDFSAAPAKARKKKSRPKTSQNDNTDPHTDQ